MEKITKHLRWLLASLLLVAGMSAWADDVTDVLTQPWTGISGTNYAAFSDKTATSDAVYAGQCAGGNSSIQLRSNSNNSGVVTTTSGGKVKSITVEWESSTQNGRTLNVYGKNTAYSAATDLYNSSNQGTLLGTIVCGTSTSLTIDGDYEYIGFRSASGAMYLESVTIVWEVGGGSSLEDNDLALTGAPIELSFDLYNNSDPQVINYTTSSTGAVTVGESDYATFSVDETNKTITVTPKAVTSGSTITVNQAANDTYKAGFATFTVKVEDSTPAGDSNWVLTNLADLTSDDVFVIVGNNGSYYAMSNSNGTGSAPSAVAVTVESGKITSDVADNLKWKISGNATDGYTFYVAGDAEKWLYCTSSNNGVRVGTNTANTFIIKDSYLFHNGTSRYIGIYSSQDWRCYTTINSNIQNQTFSFYKYDESSDTRTATTTTFNGEASYNVVLGDDFTAPTATLDPAAAGTLSYESSDPTVATVDASTGAVTILAAGTTTITAKFEGTTEYKPSQDSYTLTVTEPAVVYTSIQQLQADATSTATDITFQMTDIYVTAVTTNQAWISDGTYGALIYTNGHGLTAGQKLNGTITGKLVLYNGATEITNFDGSGLTITDAELTAQPKSIGEITVANQSLPVKFSNVTYDATNKTFSDGTNTIAYYDQFSVSPTLEDGHVYDITGVILYYNKLQIAPRSAADVVEVGGLIVPGLAYEQTSYEIIVGEAFTAPALTNPYGLTVTYAGDNDALATVDANTGELTFVDGATGEITVTASFAGNDTYEAGSASYTLTVKDGTPSTATTYEKVSSTAELSVGNQYLIVCETQKAAMGAINTYGASVDVNVESNTITITNQAVVPVTLGGSTNAYTFATEDGKYLSWSSGNSLNLSDDAALWTVEIDVDGNAIITSNNNSSRALLYNSNSPRFACYTSTQTAIQLYVIADGKQNPELSFGETTSFVVGLNAAFTAPTLTTASGFDGTVVYSSSDENIAIVDASTGEVLIGDVEGTVTITASSAATDNFRAGSASYTITVEDQRTEAGIEYAETNIIKNLGDAEFVNTLTNPNNVSVVYSSSDENVALVDENTGEVVLLDVVGNTTITATFAGDASYLPATASYTLNVVDPDAKTIAITPVIFYESFDNFAGRGGNKDAEGDEEWSGISGSTDLTDGSSYDNAGWQPTKGYEAYQCVRFGTASSMGSITSPEIAFDAGYSYTLTFLAGAWNGGSEKTTLNLSISSGNLSEESVTLAKGQWTSYTITINSAEPNTTITFEASTNSSNRFFLDEVKVVCTTPVYVEYDEANMVAGKTADDTEDGVDVHYVTYVTSHDVDMVYTENVEAYIITGTEGNTLTLQKVREIPAGTAVLLKSTVNNNFQLCETPYAFANPDGDCAANELKASDGTAKTTDAETVYVLSKGTSGTGKPGFYRLAAGRTVPAGKAYFAVPASSAKAFYGFVYDGEATAVDVVESAAEPTEKVIYNIAGQRVQNMTKGGLYIVNGKKVLVK